MPILNLGQFQLEVPYGPFAGLMTPPVGEQDTSDIQKDTSDGKRVLHRLYFPQRCQRICADSNGMATPSRCGIIRAV